MLRVLSCLNKSASLFMDALAKANKNFKLALKDFPAYRSFSRLGRSDQKQVKEFFLSVAKEESSSIAGSL